MRYTDRLKEVLLLNPMNRTPLLRKKQARAGSALATPLPGAAEPGPRDMHTVLPWAQLPRSHSCHTHDPIPGCDASHGCGPCQ